MRPVTMYEARDGSKWADANRATGRETLLDRCEAVEAILGPRPSLHGGEFVEHHRPAVDDFHVAAVKLAREYTASWDGWAKADTRGLTALDVNPNSYVGRLIDDSAGLEPIRKVWWRLACIDHLGREWDQPFFAIKAREEAKAGGVPA